MLWSGVGQALIEFRPMPVRNGNGVCGGGDPIPNVLDELEPLFQRELLNLFEQGLGSHDLQSWGEPGAAQERV